MSPHLEFSITTFLFVASLALVALWRRIRQSGLERTRYLRSKVGLRVKVHPNTEESEPCTGILQHVDDLGILVRDDTYSEEHYLLWADIEELIFTQP